VARLTGLRRAVGLRTAIATSAGMALATVSLTANVQLDLNLPGALGWIAVLAAGLISVLASFCFAELWGLFPFAAPVTSFDTGLMTASRFLYLYLVCPGMAALMLWTGSFNLFIFLGAALECLIFVPDPAMPGDLRHSRERLACY